MTKFLGWTLAGVVIFGLPAIATFAAFTAPSVAVGAAAGIVAGCLWARAANEADTMRAFVDFMTGKQHMAPKA